MPDWNPQANLVFLSARELSPGRSRDAFLDEACGGDDPLREAVAALLDAERRAGSFLESPATLLPLGTGGDGVSADNAQRTGPIECVGDQVGPYKLLQEIGEGGMGLVYLAEQREPVRRTVALKIIKPGMDTRLVVARFEAERQALALMEHPHIAKVLDGGATAAGRPYFVMELVKGLPLTQYCDEQRLTLEERLRLFIPVCQAVQHAHQKGIIHRDLKPTNVMVTLYDGRPVPKVIDFGVAKATGPRLTEQTMFTALGTVIGTLEYMSPEQAELNQLDVDTRSDVYSLGVLLYELSTGSTPLEAERARSATFDEALRIIREEPPSRPSARLSSSVNLPMLASRRGMEPRKLAERVRGDLDWIIMKALEKDRTRRYETANGLARDLERYLANEPIEARPPSTAYRFSKFAHRNRGPVAAGMLVLTALLAGIVATSWQAVRATRAERSALDSARDAIAAAEAERAARRAVAEQRRKAEDLTEFFSHRLSVMLLPVGDTQEVDEAWQSAEKLKETLASDADAKTSLLVALTRSHLAASQYDAAAEEYLEFLNYAKDPALIGAVSYEIADAIVQAGDAAEPSHLLEALPEKLGANPEAKAVLMSALVKSYRHAGHHDAALKAYREFLEVAQDTAFIDAVSWELAFGLLRAAKTQEGREILRQRFQRRLSTMTSPEAVELQAAWPGLATPEQNATPNGDQAGLQLDGDDDWVVLPGLYFDGTPPWTLEAIVRPEEIDQYVFSDGSRWTSLVSNASAGAIGLESLHGKWSIDLYTAGSTEVDWTKNYSSATARARPTLHQWQHVAGVWDGNELRLYVDGKLQQRTAPVTTCTGLSEGPFFLGADPAGVRDDDIAQGFFHGTIRAARISHGVEYTDEFTPPERLKATPATLALYDFTIDTGRYAIDCSGHGQHGIIVGAKFMPAED